VTRWRAVAAAVLLCGGLTGCGATVSGAPAEDSTRALQEQFDALRPGGVLTLSPKVYLHSGVLKIHVPDVRIEGNGATLQATNDETSSLQIDADGVKLSNLTLTAPTEGKRWMAIDQHKLVLTGSRDEVRDVRIVGSAGAGIFVYGAQDFTIADVNIVGTRADGIHMTHGSHRGSVTGVRTDKTGDDAVAVVSYAGDPSPSSDITVRNVSVASTRWGRGITVVGGNNVDIRDFDVANTDSAGLYVAAEGTPYFTDSVNSVTVSDGDITGANTNPDIVQGAVLVFSGHAGRTVAGVRISDIRIASTPKTAQRNVAIVVNSGGTVGPINLDRVQIADAGLPALSSDAPHAVTATGWTQDGKPVTVD
jgi:hypothetical protein